MYNKPQKKTINYTSILKVAFAMFTVAIIITITLFG